MGVELMWMGVDGASGMGGTLLFARRGWACGTRVGLMGGIDVCCASGFPTDDLLGVDGTFSSFIHCFHSPPFPIVLS